ncbi:MAG TPA: biliverdin-producing heme oxygenase [Kofleriaceae bacterium]|nr:biliverdin-producing heme oxygenase [Kofleriaceae bacterium]
MRTSRTLIRLDVATKAHHGAADAVWNDLFGEIGEAEYAAQLARIYGLEGPIEAALAYTPGLAARIGLRRRMRAGLIAQDLLALDLHPSQIARLPAFPIVPFSSVAEALGWMYVVERATAIHHRLREHVLALMPHLEPATTYLSAYETSIGSRWLELGEAIERVASDALGHAQVIAAAGEAFRCSREWMQRARTPLTRRVG